MRTSSASRLITPPRMRGMSERVPRTRRSGMRAASSSEKVTLRESNAMMTILLVRRSRAWIYLPVVPATDTSPGRRGFAAIYPICGLTGSVSWIRTEWGARDQLGGSRFSVLGSLLGALGQLGRALPAHVQEHGALIQLAVRVAGCAHEKVIEAVSVHVASGREVGSEGALRESRAHGHQPRGGRTPEGHMEGAVRHCRTGRARHDVVEAISVEVSSAGDHRAEPGILDVGLHRAR